MSSQRLPSGLEPSLARAPLFEGLPPPALADIASRMRWRRFAARSVVCRAGEAGASMFVILEGLADCFLPDVDAESRRAIARLRRGDVFGEVALVTGDPRSATVVAIIATTTLELDREAFEPLVARYPELLANFNRLLSRRLVAADRRDELRRRRGEALGVVAGPALAPVLPAVVSATRAASPRPVAALDRECTIEDALARLDVLLRDHGLVVVTGVLGQEGTRVLLDHVDRVVALVATPRDGEQVAALARERARTDSEVEAVAVTDGKPDVARELRLALGPASLARVVRGLDANGSARLPDSEVAWLGRHLARAKLGVALGAGGAKAYAHVGALAVLEESGYVVDYVSGSSLGALVGAYLALGMSAEEVEATLRDAFTPDAVGRLFRFSLSGRSTGQETMIRLLRETTEERSFEDLVIPLVVMTVDLESGEPAPLTCGPLHQALLAATALAGMFPAVEQGGRRLVDGLALVPVPTDSIADAGADVTLSVNLMSLDTLPSWPGERTPAPVDSGTGSRMLDTLLEVMELTQLDSSVRHAARAHVVVTPRFGPCSWRDFHFADRFLAAGRVAAEEQLASLGALARPNSPRP